MLVTGVILHQHIMFGLLLIKENVLIIWINDLDFNKYYIYSFKIK